MNKNTRKFHIVWGIAFALLALIISQTTTDRSGVYIAVDFPALVALTRFYVAWRMAYATSL